MFRRNPAAETPSNPEVLEFITSDDPDRHILLPDGITITVGKLATLASQVPDIFSTHLWKSVLGAYDPEDPTSIFVAPPMTDEPVLRTGKFIVTGKVFRSSATQPEDPTDDGT